MPRAPLDVVEAAAAAQQPIGHKGKRQAEKRDYTATEGSRHNRRLRDLHSGLL